MSLTSARVGTARVHMLSSIWVTTIKGTPAARQAAENSLRLIRLAGVPYEVPVAVGATEPLAGNWKGPDPHIHGPNGIGGVELPPSPQQPLEEPAWAFIARMAREHPGELTLVTLARMTNLAKALEIEPDLPRLLKRVVFMGGTFHAPGNVSPVAEANIAGDPEAADRVFQAGFDLTMVGLDVTRKIVLTPDLLEYMCRLNKETGEFVKKITKFYFDFHWEWEHIIGCVINDPLAVAYFINPELCKGFDSYVQIETEGISLGQSVVDSMNFYRKASNARVLTEVDVYGFFQMFLSRILDQEPEELDILQDLIRGDLK
mgnify:CR=1 FL=1